MDKFLYLFMLLSPTDVDCLAENVYFEARNQPIEGQAAVAAVTINRLLDIKYPNTICEVVYQPKQFSWTLNGYKKPKDIKALRIAYDVSLKTIYGEGGIYKDPINGAVYYHSRHIQPNWDFSKLEKVVTISDHVFYADK